MQEAIFFKNVTTFLIATLWIGRQEERDQKVLDKMLASDLKKASAYILEGVAVTDVLLWRGHKLTAYALGWLQEYIDNKS